jgi:hypothetical protein
MAAGDRGPGVCVTCGRHVQDGAITWVRGQSRDRRIVRCGRTDCQPGTGRSWRAPTARV